MIHEQINGIELNYIKRIAIVDLLYFTR